MLFTPIGKRLPWTHLENGDELLSLAEDLGHLGADVGRTVDDVDAALAHDTLLGFGRLVFTGHDGAGVAHGATLGCRDACDEAA